MTAAGDTSGARDPGSGQPGAEPTETEPAAAREPAETHSAETEPAEAAPTGGWSGRVSLPRAIASALIAHARSEYPNEACGIVVGTASAGEGGLALRFEATRNAAASPFRYEIAADDLFRIALETDNRDEGIWGIFHSHTHTPARPSATDIGLAFYPDSLYLLVSLDPAETDRTTGEPSLRAWRIEAGEATEIELAPELEATE